MNVTVGKRRTSRQWYVTASHRTVRRTHPGDDMCSDCRWTAVFGDELPSGTS